MSPDKPVTGDGSGLNVSRETRERLEIYVEMLTRWNRKINLVGPKTLDDIWSRHVQDSIQLAGLAPNVARNWVDLGSGAGLPGLLIAAVRETEGTGGKVLLIDSDERKCIFMAEAASKMGLTSVEIVKGRLGRGSDLAEQTFDVISARALAPLEKLFGYAAPFSHRETVCLFPKGENWAEEVKQAELSWKFSYREIPSVTRQDAVILSVSRFTSLKDGSNGR